MRFGWSYWDDCRHRRAIVSIRSINKLRIKTIFIDVRFFCECESFVDAHKNCLSMPRNNRRKKKKTQMTHRIALNHYIFFSTKHCKLATIDWAAITDAVLISHQHLVIVILWWHSRFGKNQTKPNQSFSHSSSIFMDNSFYHIFTSLPSNF